MEEASTVNIVLPNRPHATALQVEEIGSYKLEQHEQSVSYQILDDGTEGKSRIYTQGIIDEIDSDTDHKGMRTSMTTSRNVSINSVSEDEGSVGTGTQISRELHVEEQTKNVELDDGFAEIKVKRIVLQEEEVTTAEIHDADENRFDIGDGKRATTKDLQRELEEKKSHAKVASVEEAGDMDNEATAQKPRISRQSSLSNEKARKGSLYDIEEKYEYADLTPEEAKQQRIKEIRAKARRASLLNKESKTENNLLTDDEKAKPTKPDVSDVGDETDHAQSGKLFDKRDIADEEDAPKSLGKKATEQPIETSDKLRNGSESNHEPEEDRDEYLENLLKRAQRQRSQVDDIVEGKASVVADDASSKRGVQAAVEESTPVEVDQAKLGVESAGSHSCSKFYCK